MPKLENVSKMPDFLGAITPPSKESKAFADKTNAVLSKTKTSSRPEFFSPISNKTFRFSDALAQFNVGAKSEPFSAQNDDESVAKKQMEVNSLLDTLSKHEDEMEDLDYNLRLCQHLLAIDLNDEKQTEHEQPYTVKEIYEFLLNHDCLDYSDLTKVSTGISVLVQQDESVRNIKGEEFLEDIVSRKNLITLNAEYMKDEAYRQSKLQELSLVECKDDLYLDQYKKLLNLEELNEKRVLVARETHLASEILAINDNVKDNFIKAKKLFYKHILTKPLLSALEELKTKLTAKIHELRVSIKNIEEMLAQAEVDIDIELCESNNKKKPSPIPQLR